MMVAGILVADNNNRLSEAIESIFLKAGKRIKIIDCEELLAQIDFLQISPVEYLQQLKNDDYYVLLIKLKFNDLYKKYDKLLNFFYFDIMLIDEIADEFNEGNNSFNSITDKTYSCLQKVVSDEGIIIINSDKEYPYKFLKEVRHYVFTYGFNSKACITASSIGEPFFDEKILCFLQRTLELKKDKTLEPQEFYISTERFEPNETLAAVSLALICGVVF